ncbi:MAG: hypothetical protein LQ342_004135 [Letrouitia transgressa]|nr:MAG: hypothetical protein LQ342_004135 [Letrouitia transgressa]
MASASILRQIVAGPRQKHPEAGLDLCYVTDDIIATSGPSSTYPQRAYRNPTDALVKFLDYKHGVNWAIWEFRAEGTGYPDSEVHGRIRHYPWPDHHPPPFALVPNIVASMRDWLKGPDAPIGRVVVVHCKAGKGRSGTAACSYLISEEGWTVEDALQRFTTKRMRLGFGAGISIPSQLRWIGYVDRWTKHQKLYVERRVEVCEIHAWGLRDGVKVAVEGYVDEGRTIKTFHVYRKPERINVDADAQDISEPPSATKKPLKESISVPDELSKKATVESTEKPPLPPRTNHTGSEEGGAAVIFRASDPIVLPTGDVNIDFERRNRATYGWTMVTSVAHVWFNAFFEGKGPENNGNGATNGVFEIEWDALDGIKGSARKGTKAFDQLAVVWRLVEEKEEPHLPRLITEPKLGEPVPQMKAADWKDPSRSNLAALGKDLGLRTESPASADVSKASSLRSATLSPLSADASTVEVTAHQPEKDDHT